MSVNPLLASPNSDLFYLTDSLQATINKIDYVVENRQGLTVVYGDVGLGKTALMQYMFDRYSADESKVVVYLPTPRFSTDVAFLRGICAELDLPRKRSMVDQEQELRAYLAEQLAAGRIVVALVDEAQIIPGRVLELVRLLLNLDTRHGKLIQIVLCGQIELRDRMRDPSKKALRSRIFITSTLDPLTLDEADAMIAYRLEKAGQVNPFTREVLEDIWTKAKGVPREILKRCAMSAKLSAGATGAMVTHDAVDFVEADVEPV
jgi:type II secretory pathway predicted ATPase ExeA